MSQQINLYNPALRPRRELFSSVNVAVATAVTLGFVVVVGTLASNVLSRQRNEARAADAALKLTQDRLTALSQALAATKPNQALKAELDGATGLARTRDEVLEALRRGVGINGAAGSYSEVLLGLARQSLSGVWLTGISADPVGGSLELRGRTLEAPLVADYVRRLNVERSLTGRSFTALSMDHPKLAEKAEGGVAEKSPKSQPAPYLDFTLSSGAASTSATTTDKGGHS